jgi:hypothetical protein
MQSEVRSVQQLWLTLPFGVYCGFPDVLLSGLSWSW